MQPDNRQYRSNADIARRREAARRRKIRQRRRRIALAVFAGLIVALTVSLVIVFRFRNNIKSSITVEAGDALPPVDAFIEKPDDSVKCETDISGINTTVPGDYPVVFSSGMLSKTSTLQIRDTIPPVAVSKDVRLALGSQAGVADFIEKVEDKTAVEARYITAPDFSIAGSQQVQIELVDRGGNKVTISANLEIFDDDQPPVIEGTKDITVYVGETATYRNGVNVTDNKDQNPKLKIDSSAVNLDVPGVYQVIYTATDAAGNESSVTVNVTVKERPENYEDVLKLNQKADELLEKLKVKDMPEVEKAFTIFRWVRKNIPWYGGRIQNHDSVVQALKGLAGNTGDCYTCAVTCQVLMERAGFDVKFMERKNTLGLHYWLMVKVEGNWYHMDPSPIYLHQFVCFLGTDEQIKWFSKDMRPGYYDHDYSQYPATPDTPLATAEYKNGEYTLVYGGQSEESI